jgi:Amt family ammonium transporter
VLRSGSSCIVEYLLELAGHERFFKATLLPTPLQDGEGQLDNAQCIAVVVRDVTAQQEAQRELREKQELYQHLFDANPQPLWVYDTETSQIVAVNDAALQQYGYRREEFLSRTISDLYFTDNAAPSGTSFKPDGAWRHSKKDGSVFHARVTSHELLFNGRGARLVLAHDVTERIETEAALQAAEAKYRSIFENAIEGIFQTTPAGVYLTANPMLARLYGYSSPDELTNAVTDIGQQIYVEPGRRDEFARRMQQDGHVENFESPIRRRDGQIIWISENARAMRDESGAVVGYEGTTIDITARKQAEAERRHAEEALRQSETACATSWSIRAICSTRSRPITCTLMSARSRALSLAAHRKKPLTHAGPTFLPPTASTKTEFSSRSAPSKPAKRSTLPSRTQNTRWSHAVGRSQRSAGCARWKNRGYCRCACRCHQAHANRAGVAASSVHDPLTDLPNRALFMDRLEHALARSNRQKQQSAVLFLDLDRFKIVNDSLGHEVGDLLLKGVAKRLQSCLRPGDTAARLGGDEFTVLIEDISDVNDAIHVAERIAQELQTPFNLSGQEVL